MEQTVVQIEPEGPSLDNLVLAEASMEPAVEHEFQVIPSAGLDQEVALRLATEVTHTPLCIVFGHVQPGTGVVPDQSGWGYTPVEEAAQDIGVGVSGRGGVGGQVMIVKVLRIRRRDVSGRYLADEPGKRLQDEPAPVSTGRGELMLTPFVSDEGFNLGVEQIGRGERRMNPDFSSSRLGLGEVGRFKTHKLANALDLEVQPVNRATQIQALSVGIFHAGRLSQISVTLRKSVSVYIAAIWRVVGERVTRFERATSSLARLLSALWIVTLLASHLP